MNALTKQGTAYLYAEGRLFLPWRVLGKSTGNYDRSHVHPKNDLALDYKIRNTSMSAQPIALTLDLMEVDIDDNSEPWHLGHIEFSGALYFDRTGKIIDRAPALMGASARGFQNLYSEDLETYLLAGKSRSAMRAPEDLVRLIQGFFDGESGIKRNQGILIRENL